MNLNGIKNRIEKLKPFVPDNPVTEIIHVICKPHRDAEGVLTAVPTGEVIVQEIKPWW